MKTFLATTAVALAMATGAQAVTLDFVAIAAGTPGDRGGVEGQQFFFGDLGVTLTSSADAYLDDLSGNPAKPAGLGVCSAGLNGTQCSDPSDDNVTHGEWVKLTFSKAVSSLTNFVFYDANHNDITTTKPIYVEWIDSFSPWQADSTFGALEGDLASNVIGNYSEISFFYSGSVEDNNQFYLGSVDATLAAVPLPAGVLLLLTAMGGLGVASRRRKAVA